MNKRKKGTRRRADVDPLIDEHIYQEEAECDKCSQPESAERERERERKVTKKRSKIKKQNPVSHAYTRITHIRSYTMHTPLSHFCLDR